MTIHHEKHKVGSLLSDIILGGQDGLVNVLGVILGVAAASSDFRIVIVAGLAATFAESISMGAVAYTSTKADAEYYESEYEREKREIKETPEIEKEEVRRIFSRWGFSGTQLTTAVATITKDENVWLDVMMGSELNLAKVDRNKALLSSFIVGISALVGSLVPLTPFFFLAIKTAIPVSILLSALTLFTFGYYKAIKTVGNGYRSGFELTVIGIVSALTGYLVGLVLKLPPTF